METSVKQWIQWLYKSITELFVGEDLYKIQFIVLISPMYGSYKTITERDARFMSMMGYFDIF